jgi:protein phosphatase PTC1
MNNTLNYHFAQKTKEYDQNPYKQAELNKLKNNGSKNLLTSSPKETKNPNERISTSTIRLGDKNEIHLNGNGNSLLKNQQKKLTNNLNSSSIPPTNRRLSIQQAPLSNKLSMLNSNNSENNNDLNMYSSEAIKFNNNRNSETYATNFQKNNLPNYGNSPTFNKNNPLQSKNGVTLKVGENPFKSDPYSTLIKNNGRNIQQLSSTLNRGRTVSDLEDDGKVSYMNNNIKYLESKKITEKKNNGVYNPSAKCVKEYSYKEEKNLQFRNSMEDFCKIIDKFSSDVNRGFFSLYDGHGGTEIVKYVKDRMPEVFGKFLQESNQNSEKSLLFTFQKVDDEIKLMSNSENIGTTACICYITRESDIISGSKKVLYCANVGDTRCILVSSSEVKRLSYDHKCIDEAEANRIKKAGGAVFNGRVFGQLALSRAIGDHSMKKYGVIPTPHIKKHVINDRDKYVVLASDGVWDVISEDDIFNMAQDSSNSNELSDTIIRKAVENGSRDNITCVVIKLN